MEDEAQLSVGNCTRIVHVIRASLRGLCIMKGVNRHHACRCRYHHPMPSNMDQTRVSNVSVFASDTILTVARLLALSSPRRNLRLIGRESFSMAKTS